MSRVATPGNTGDVGRFIDRRPFESPIGLKMLVPGWPHLCWGQRQRGWVFLGSFAISLMVGLWIWGTWLSWGVLAFAFVTHVVSATDVLRQRSFPIYPSRTAMVVVAATLGLLFYVPVLSVLSLIAWPGFEPDGTGNGFLDQSLGLSRRGAAPGPMDLDASASVRRAAGRSGRRGFRARSRMDRPELEGRRACSCRCRPTCRLMAWPLACRFKVPANQILVEPQDDGEIDSAARSACARVAESNHRSCLGPVLSRLGSPLALNQFR